MQGRDLTSAFPLIEVLLFYDAYIGGTLSMAVDVLIPAPDSARITSYKLSLQYERLKASDIGFTK